MLADVAQRGGAEQRIGQRVQQHVAVGMGDQAELVGDSHAAEGDEIALAETVHVVAVADTHDGNTLPKSGRDSNRKVPAGAGHGLPGGRRRP
ncbi:hypothetical protein D9M70_337280 [compost metagenome]